MIDKPKIDWTRPLRAVGTHRQVGRVTIECTGAIWVVFGDGHGFEVNKDGRAVKDEPLQRGVENIPPEPRIVERWIVLHPLRDGHYMVAGEWQQYAPPQPLHERPVGVPAHYRIARVLIEEPGE